MFKKLAIVLVALSLMSPVAAVAKEKIYKTETNAIKYCQGDTVVWVNPTSGIYHLSDSRYYGNTKDGYYMCREAAERDGNRPSKTK